MPDSEEPTSPPDATPSDTAKIVKSKLFTFPAGDVILQTTTKPITQYRLYGKHLALHSGVFKEAIASLESPATGQNSTTDKHRSKEPVLIEVSGSSEDWELVIPLIHGLEPTVAFVSLPAVFAVQRLDVEYNLHRLIALFDEQIEAILPSSFKDWEYNYLFDKLWRDHLRGHEFALLKVMVDMREKESIPLARFFCVEQKSMVLRTCDEESDLPALPRRLLFRARDRLRKACIDKTCGWWWTPRTVVSIRRCSDPAGCKKVTRVAQRKLALHDFTLEEALIPKAILDHSAALCESCRKEEEKARVRGMQQIFDELPEYFRS